MTADMAALIIVVLVTLIFMMRRTHVALTTMALCGGYVLSDRVSAVFINGSTELSDTDELIYTIAKITLLFGPPLILAVHFRDSQKGSGRFIEQIVPAFSLSLLLILFVVEQLSLTVQNSLLDKSVVFNQMWVYSPWIVLFALSTAFFDLMIHKPKDKKGSKKKGKRRYL